MKKEKTKIILTIINIIIFCILGFLLKINLIINLIIFTTIEITIIILLKKINIIIENKEKCPKCNMKFKNIEQEAERIVIHDLGIITKTELENSVNIVNEVPLGGFSNSYSPSGNKINNNKYAQSCKILVENKYKKEEVNYICPKCKNILLNKIEETIEI